MKTTDDSVSIEINGLSGAVAAGTTVAAAIALLNNVRAPLRTSVTGMPRGALCGMGVCHECHATINGVAHRRSCLVECMPGMRIHTDGL